MAILEVSNLKKIYTTRFGGNQVQALKNINFSVEEGEYVAIMGESGSGKTTLLNILAALDKPTAGEVLLNGKNLATVYKGNIIKNLIMDCQSYTKYRPNETTGGIFVSWRRKEELPTGA